MPFTELGLSAEILAAIEEMGYKEPTPIQASAIPLILKGTDIIGSAQTGTGKTAAFGLPILQKLEKHDNSHIRALILEPTRELAAQVDEAMRKFAKNTDLHVSVIYGGVGYGKQREELSAGIDVLVATPGRLLDLARQGDCRLNKVDYVVLDEADRMLDMGFMPDVRAILEMCPRNRHTSLFSATIPPVIETMITWAMREPQSIEIGRRQSAAETVKHVIYEVAHSQKDDLLLAILDQVHYESVIIFCRTKMGADTIARLLNRNKHSVVALHSDRSQKERDEALQGFRDGKYEVLVATDIASRGLDITKISHVVNYDVPENAEDYVHRIGRTGRAESEGDAFTLMVAEDAIHVNSIERYIDQKVPRERLEGFDYKYTALFDHHKDGTTSPHDRKFKQVRVAGGYHFSASGGRGKKRRRKR